jgi:hypothetical protein
MSRAPMALVGDRIPLAARHRLRFCGASKINQVFLSGLVIAANLRPVFQFVMIWLSMYPLFWLPKPPSAN